MSQLERTGQRDMLYSKFHRWPSAKRWLPLAEARRLHYMDLDAVEFCAGCKTPLVLIELARDVGQARKPTTVTQRLAHMAGLPALLVYYTRTQDGQDIERFRVRVIAPMYSSYEDVLTPRDYFALLALQRTFHTCESNR